ncbi:MAG: bifunctional phosphopantothenoylcysteine decarboxylase/phosphopantothenate--cysteine ligase CoaBC [Gammaproteobacteria bacterium]|nr:MAG: bifunctional phosphopantothenoylcysteine decarboxylase/phosphopantothenate--cysteine ligase CoaBC [Gammaproteobacteria bacterium]
MSSLSGQHILLGVSGGIAAYKSCELVRLLRRAGAEVRVVMTRGATGFVTPLSFQALSGNPVRCELFDPEAEAGMGHIELARWADKVVIAPASADLLARLALGLADDLLATLCLATTAPIAVAPAMNRVMWEHPATAAHVESLRGRGVTILGPAEGEQACGEEGPGRMVEPQAIIDHLAAIPGPLEGVRVLVTAGPTREALDPVRFLGNRSSGRMGYALAEAARDAGAVVTLVSGPVALPAPQGVETVRVEDARQMHEAVMARIGGVDLFIAAAAVADYRPKAPAADKIKKTHEGLTVELVRNPDILAEVAALQEGPFTVGFAAETSDLEAHAREKLERKGCDLVVANRVGEGLAFDQEENEVLLLWRGGSEHLPRQPKRALARQLIERIARRYAQD